MSVLQLLPSVDAGMGLYPLRGCMSLGVQFPQHHPQAGTRLLEPQTFVFLSPPCRFASLSLSLSLSHTHTFKGALGCYRKAAPHWRSVPSSCLSSDTKPYRTKCGAQSPIPVRVALSLTFLLFLGSRTGSHTLPEWTEGRPRGEELGPCPGGTPRLMVR